MPSSPHFSRTIAALTTLSLTLGPIQPGHAAEPDPETLKLVTDRYNSFIETESRSGCAYYANPTTLKSIQIEGESGRSVSVLKQRDKTSGYGGSLCNGTFEFLVLMTNCDQKTAYYTPALGDRRDDQTRQQIPIINGGLIEPICRSSGKLVLSPELTPNAEGDYRFRRSPQQNWEVVDADSAGLKCRMPQKFHGKFFDNTPSENAQMGILEFLLQDNQPDIGSWESLRSLKKGTRLYAYGQVGTFTVADRNGKPWLPVAVTSDNQPTNRNNIIGNCFVRANKQFIKPV